MRNPIKSYFAPFRAKIAEAEAVGCGVEFLEFYVLLPAWLCYETVYVVQVYQNLLVKTAGLDWSILVQFFITTAWLSLIYTGRMLLLWQYISLRRFSRTFLFALRAQLVFDLVRSAVMYTHYHEIEWIEVLFRQDVLYALIVWYFLRRRWMFGKQVQTDGRRGGGAPFFGVFEKKTAQSTAPRQVIGFWRLYFHILIPLYILIECNGLQTFYAGCGIESWLTEQPQFWLVQLLLWGKIALLLRQYNCIRVCSPQMRTSFVAVLAFEVARFLLLSAFAGNLPDLGWVFENTWEGIAFDVWMFCLFINHKLI